MNVQYNIISNAEQMTGFFMQKNHSCFKLEELEIKCGKYGVIG